jgi:hypothetical protein
MSLFHALDALLPKEDHANPQAAQLAEAKAERNLLQKLCADEATTLVEQKQLVQDDLTPDKAPQGALPQPTRTEKEIKP